MARLLGIPIVFVLAFFLFYPKTYEPLQRINGVNLEAPRNPTGKGPLNDVKNLGANYVSVIPFGFIADSTGTVHFNSKRQWWGETDEGIRGVIADAHSLGIRVMVKPHVWVRGDGWPGDYLPSSPESWQKWMDSYRDYIIAYAKIARDQDAELFCIGTEFRKTASARPEYWESLITEVREIYKGKITYAANWDNIQNIRFWDKLDYIGVDAYFPLSPERSPTSEDLAKAWKKPARELKALADKWDRPILFTEYGYRSIDFTANGHWLSDENDNTLNMQGQANAYQALYQSVWNEPWMAGGFLWKWHMEIPERMKDRIKTAYSPQDKPAEDIIKKAYTSRK